MSTWVFALIVLCIGVGLAFYVDRLKLRPGGRSNARTRRERSKWLYYWFVGRFPTKDEQEEDDRQSEEAEQDEKDARAEEEARRKRGK